MKCHYLVLLIVEARLESLDNSILGERSLESGEVTDLRQPRPLHLLRCWPLSASLSLWWRSPRTWRLSHWRLSHWRLGGGHRRRILTSDLWPLTSTHCWHVAADHRGWSMLTSGHWADVGVVVLQRRVSQVRPHTPQRRELVWKIFQSENIINYFIEKIMKNISKGEMLKYFIEEMLKNIWSY